MEIAQGLERGLILKPSVAVEVSTYRPFYILGEVNTPGQYPFRPDMTVLTAISIAGGFTYRAVQGYVGVTRDTSGCARDHIAPHFLHWRSPAMSSLSMSAISRTGWTVDLAVFAAGFLTFVNMWCTQAILPVLAAAFHVSQAQTGLSVTAPLIATALHGAGDRRDFRPVRTQGFYPLCGGIGGDPDLGRGAGGKFRYVRAVPIRAGAAAAVHLHRHHCLYRRRDERPDRGAAGRELYVGGDFRRVFRAADYRGGDHRNSAGGRLFW